MRDLGFQLEPHAAVAEGTAVFHPGTRPPHFRAAEAAIRNADAGTLRWALEISDLGKRAARAGAPLLRRSNPTVIHLKHV
jgi:hypothetical protein